MTYTPAVPYFYGTGRRKTSVARVRVMAGPGSIRKTLVKYCK